MRSGFQKVTNLFNYDRYSTYYFSVMIYGNVKNLALSLIIINVHNMLKVPWMEDGQKSKNYMKRFN